MTPTEFADKVAAMREAQKKYFRTRSTQSFQLSKILEKEVDTILANRKPKQKDEYKQESLFNAE